MSIGFSRQLAQLPAAVILIAEVLVMKKMLLPLSVFLLGLFIADFFFGVDVAKLAGGFGTMLADMFTATRP